MGLGQFAGVLEGWGSSGELVGIISTYAGTAPTPWRGAELWPTRDWDPGVPRFVIVASCGQKTQENQKHTNNFKMQKQHTYVYIYITKRTTKTTATHQNKQNEQKHQRRPNKTTKPKNKQITHRFVFETLEFLGLAWFPRSKNLQKSRSWAKSGEHRVCFDLLAVLILFCFFLCVFHGNAGL